MACGILVPRSGTERWPLAVRAQSSNHWTARQFPAVHRFKIAALPLSFLVGIYICFILYGPCHTYLFVENVAGFPGGSDGKESACNSRDPRSLLGSGRSPGGGNGNSLQYSCLENSMDRGTWWATVHEITKRHDWATNTFTFTVFKSTVKQPWL